MCLLFGFAGMLKQCGTAVENHHQHHHGGVCEN
jgi:hypothetical protein